MIIIWRALLPETNHFQVAKAEREERERQKREAAGSHAGAKKTDMFAFLKESNKAMQQNWFLFAYMVVLMTGFNSCSHGSQVLFYSTHLLCLRRSRLTQSQDLYPTFLKNQAGMSPTQVTVITVVGQIGALIGSTLMGYLSTFTGRRLAMMVSCVFGGAIVPAYMLPRGDKLIASVFFEQWFVGAVWGKCRVAYKVLGAGKANKSQVQFLSI